MRLYTILFLFLAIANFSYSMEKTEEEMFQENLQKLNQPIVEFVLDFKTWPQKEQDKIKLCSNSGGANYIIQGKLAVDNKYEDSLSDWLDCRLLSKQIIPFFLALDYLKKQK